MATWKRYTAALLGAALLSSVWMATADAKPKPGTGKKDQQPTVTQPVINSTTQTTTTTTRRSTTFSTEQRSRLTNLLNGRVVRNDVLDANTRTLVTSQISSLPPGIQKRLARGKGLPPGIAKKVFLPKTVNSYLNVPAQYDLIVLGSNVVMYDSVTSIVIDFIAGFV